jgi:hypothetical protein
VVPPMVIVIAGTRKRPAAMTSRTRRAPCLLLKGVDRPCSWTSAACSKGVRPVFVRDLSTTAAPVFVPGSLPRAMSLNHKLPEPHVERRRGRSSEGPQIHPERRMWLDRSQ